MKNEYWRSHLTDIGGWTVPRKEHMLLHSSNRLARAHAVVFLLQNGLDVTPVIGILSDRDLFKPVLNKAEVEDIFDAPLEMFLKVQP